MANYDFQPGKSKRLSGAEELRAYAHPTRMAILAALANDPLTLTKVAHQMQVHPANLSRHFRALERAGLIVLVETRDTGRNLEKYYQAAATSFVPDFQELSPAGKREMALGILRDELNAAILRVRAGELVESDILVLMSAIRLRPTDMMSFARKLERLMKQFMACDDERGNACTLGLSLFPADYHNEHAEKIRITERSKK